jgi:hypothetical protein
MIEAMLTRANAARKTRITVKSLTALTVIILAVALPQLVHLAVGASGGVTWLPMYLPVLLGGCLLGARWGMAVGVLSPVVSFLLTSLIGNAMPAAVRLPFMAAELALMALVTGLFSNAVVRYAWLAFPAVLAAQAAGRSFFLLLVVLFQNAVPFTPALVWSQIKAGVNGLALQAVVIPLAVMAIRHLANIGEKNSD